MNLRKADDLFSDDYYFFLLTQHSAPLYHTCLIAFLLEYFYQYYWCKRQQTWPTSPHPTWLQLYVIICQPSSILIVNGPSLTKLIQLYFLATYLTVYLASIEKIAFHDDVIRINVFIIYKHPTLTFVFIWLWTILSLRWNFYKKYVIESVLALGIHIWSTSKQFSPGWVTPFSNAYLTHVHCVLHHVD